MPDPIKTEPTSPEEIANNNAEVAAKLADQDSAGHPSAGTDDTFANVGEALDKARDAILKEKEEERDASPVTEVVVTAKTAEDPDAAKKADEAAAAAKAAEEAKQAANDRFKDAPQLPPGASTKSHEAFAAIKVKAAQELSAKEKEVADLKKSLAEREEKLKNPIPKEILDELADHRAFRAKLDVDVDPKFKELDKGIDATREFCYAQLRKSPVVTDATIDAIKKAGGIDNISLSKLFEAIEDPTMQRLVETKVADIEQRKYEKQQAIDSAKGNITDYLKQRETDLAKADQAHYTGTKEHLDKLLEGEDFLKSKDGDEDHNKNAAEYKRDIEEALKDKSPFMRAVLIQGTVRLFHERKEHAKVSAERDGLKKEVETLTAKIDSMKKSSTTRLRDSAAPSDGRMPEAKDDSQVFTEKSGSALDRIAREIAAKRESSRVDR